jgi:hypothetical protein
MALISAKHPARHVHVEGPISEARICTGGAGGVVAVVLAKVPGRTADRKRLKIFSLRSRELAGGLELPLFNELP